MKKPMPYCETVMSLGFGGAGYPLFYYYIILCNTIIL